ncbi:MAG: double zinc ribbon domain-containing protein [Candidatus Kariarchaeaceae archaeon]
MEKACKNCGTLVPQRAKFCRKCRSTEFDEPRVCPHCDSVIVKADINFCPTCGKRLSAKELSRQWMIKAPDAEQQTCNICRQPVELDLVFCPGCTNAFHFNHISSWIVDNSNCPVCKTKLVLQEKE